MESFEDNQTTRKNRRTVQASTTLSRKYARRPSIGEKKATSSNGCPSIQHFNRAFTDTTASGQMEDLVMEELFGNPSRATNDLYEAMQEARKDDTQKVNVVVGRKKVERPITVEYKTAEKPTISAMAEALARADEFRQERAPAQVKVQTQAQTQVQTQPKAHPIQISVNTKMRERTLASQAAAVRPSASAKELKEQAIRKALASANSISSEQEGTKTRKTIRIQKNTAKAQKIARPKKQRTKKTLHFGFGRVMLALSCATAAVAAIVYFVNLNMPDLSLRVAAMQTGIDPTYPTYIPRNYSVSGITSKEGEIRIEFLNSTDGKHFTLIEEKSSWDTNALLSNFVKGEYGEDYTIVKEQGLTIYISGSNAAWVNGGNVYKIEATNSTLTNKQIRSIAVSL